MCELIFKWLDFDIQIIYINPSSIFWRITVSGYITYLQANDIT